MKFGWFYAGELLHAFTFGGFIAILFFGGMEAFLDWTKLAALAWLNIPFVQALCVYCRKAMFGYWVIMWIKYSGYRRAFELIICWRLTGNSWSRFHWWCW